MSVFKRPFLDLLADLRRGKVNADLTDAVHELMQACVDTGKKGSLTLSLTFEPDKNDESRFAVLDQITVKTPRRTVKPSLFYLTRDGNLSRTDPDQDAFEGLREVPDTNTNTGADANASRKAN